MHATTDARTLLLAEHKAALEQLAALQHDFSDIVDASASANADDEHDPEGATIAFERQHIAALLSQASEHVRQVADALRRVDDGSYGRCERCGQQIAAGRLAARPTATTCIGCASGRKSR